MNRRHFLQLVGAAAAAPMPLSAQSDFPSRPVKIIVPFPAGGTADVLPRLLAEKLRERWDQPVLIENRTGAGGNIGADAVFRADPDGYTLLASPPGPLAINQSLYSRLPYDATRFVPVTVIASVPNVMAVSPKVAAKSVAEFVEFARANPEKVNFASQGNGSTSHLTASLFQTIAGVRMTHVPYKGTAPALADLAGGQVDVFFDNLGASSTLHKSGKIRILAIADSKRSSAVPEVPTFGELGMPGMQALAWFGVVAPPGTPEPIVQRLNDGFVQALREPDIRQKFAEQGAEPLGLSPQQMARFVAEETAKWRKVIQEAKVTVD